MWLFEMKYAKKYFNLYDKIKAQIYESEIDLLELAISGCINKF